MITGYYAANADSRVLLKRALKLIKMLLIAEAVFGVWTVVRVLIVKGSFSVVTWFTMLEIYRRPFKVLFCGTLFNGTLWYVYAAVWTYFILILFKKIRLSTRVYKYIIAVTMSLHVIGRFVIEKRYGLDEQSTWIFCNAVLFLLPMTLTGMLLNIHAEEIREKWSVSKSIVLILSGNAMIVAEFFLSGEYMDFHYSTFVIALGLMLLALTWNRPLKKPGLVLAAWGRDLSGIIYLSHFLFKSILKTVGDMTGLTENKLFAWCVPFATLGCAMLTAVVFRQMKKKTRK